MHVIKNKRVHGKRSAKQPGQQDEEDAIGPGDWWPFHLSIEHDELVS